MSERPFIVENFDSYISDKVHYKKLESYMPDPAKHILIIGATGRGKSTHLLNMLKYMYFDKLYVFAKDIEEEIYEKVLKPQIENMEYQINSKIQTMKKGKTEPVKIGYFHNDMKDLPKLEDMDRKTQKIMIWDDFLNDKKANETIKNYFTMSRKKGVSCIYLSQNLFDVPKLIRKNVQYVVIFDNGSAKEKQEIAKVYASKIPYYDFLDIYNDIMQQDEHAYMVIDLTAKRLNGYIRRSWDDFCTMQNYEKMVKKRELQERQNRNLKKTKKITYNYDIDETSSDSE